MLHSRRNFLKAAAAGVMASALAACQPQIVKETVVVEKEVEKLVKETVVVKEAVEVEKEVTRVVEKAAEASPGIVTVRYLARAGGAEEVLYQDRLSQFNAENDDVKAVLESIPGGGEEFGPKVLALHAGGTMGDALWTSIGSVLHYFFAAKGILAELEPLIDSTKFDMSPFFPSSVESCKLKGTLYGLPLKAHPGGAFIFYNKTMFEEEGVPEPTDEWTMNDMLEAAKALTKDVNGNGRTDNWGLNMYTGRLNDTLCRAYGGDFIDATGTKALINKDETMEALRWQYDLYHTHKVSPTPQSLSGINEFQLMASGKMAMFQAGPWGGPVVSKLVKGGDAGARFEWWVTPLPWGPANVRGTHAEVDCVAVYSGSAHKEQAFRLCQYFTDREAGVQLGLGDGVLGARNDLLSDERLQGGVHSSDDVAFFKMMREITADSLPYYYPANLRGQEAFLFYGQGLDPLWVGDAEPTDGFFDEANAGLQTILDRPPA